MDLTAWDDNNNNQQGITHNNRDTNTSSSTQNACAQDQPPPTLPASQSPQLNPRNSATASTFSFVVGRNNQLEFTPSTAAPSRSSQAVFNISKLPFGLANPPDHPPDHHHNTPATHPVLGTLVPDPATAGGLPTNGPTPPTSTTAPAEPPQPPQNGLALSITFKRTT